MKCLDEKGSATWRWDCSDDGFVEPFRLSVSSNHLTLVLFDIITFTYIHIYIYIVCLSIILITIICIHYMYTLYNMYVYMYIYIYIYIPATIIWLACITLVSSLEYHRPCFESNRVCRTLMFWTTLQRTVRRNGLKKRSATLQRDAWTRWLNDTLGRDDVFMRSLNGGLSTMLRLAVATYPRECM